MTWVYGDLRSNLNPVTHNWIILSITLNYLNLSLLTRKNSIAVKIGSDVRKGISIVPGTE